MWGLQRDVQWSCWVCSSSFEVCCRLSADLNRLAVSSMWHQAYLMSWSPGQSDLLPDSVNGNPAHGRGGLKLCNIWGPFQPGRFYYSMTQVRIAAKFLAWARCLSFKWKDSDIAKYTSFNLANFPLTAVLSSVLLSIILWLIQILYSQVKMDNSNKGRRLGCSLYLIQAVSKICLV